MGYFIEEHFVLCHLYDAKMISLRAPLNIVPPRLPPGPSFPTVCVTFIKFENEEQKEGIIRIVNTKGIKMSQK